MSLYWSNESHHLFLIGGLFWYDDCRIIEKRLLKDLLIGVLSGTNMTYECRLIGQASLADTGNLTPGLSYHGILSSRFTSTGFCLIHAPAMSHSITRSSFNNSNP